VWSRIQIKREVRPQTSGGYWPKTWRDARSPPFWSADDDASAVYVRTKFVPAARVAGDFALDLIRDHTTFEDPCALFFRRRHGR